MFLIAYVAPLWLSHYVPTQDGPSHLSNAILYRDYGKPGTRYREFYERRLSALPNWTSHLVLAALTSEVPPLVAEKILVSVYVLGLPLALCYFFGSLGGDVASRALFGFLFLSNRCLFLGFYNYCLSVCLFFVALGFAIRRRQTMTAPGAALLGSLSLLLYFTHLVGCLLAVGSVLWIALFTPGARTRRLARLLVALVPTALLVVGYFREVGLLQAHTTRRALRHVIDSLPRDPGEALGAATRAVDRELFAVQAGPGSALGPFVLFLLALLLLSTLAFRRDYPVASEAPRRSVAFLGGAIALLCVLAPDSLGVQGGFLKARLVLLPPLLWLGFLRLPPRGWPRRATLALVALAIGVNLAFVMRYFHQANAEIAEFAAAVPQAGRNRTLVSVRPASDVGQLANALAVEYYCLDTGNVCLDSYEAATPHFPLKFRAGVKETIQAMSRDGEFWTDLVLAWDAPPERLPGPEDPYRETYRRGRLRMFERIETGALRGSVEALPVLK